MSGIHEQGQGSGKHGGYYFDKENGAGDGQRGDEAALVSGRVDAG
ncbi:hypothetical protein HMPREF3193_01878 [Bifidobacterium breve]|uniref:Uncharacterized protein n=1 Tax=Bifidobacterium breve DSM 20213 = JCM 1192 TaxID=518634 RepID=D4BRQ7_BIFBR|nr:hypothetical protein BIFBRE_04797 [Bifidobacterium breve DSM 20213 = JCM 1192]ERI84995.1 hypothetical protein HMPREF1587_02192 [Bifidobacterium breve JCP7499]KWZ83782.1 hypothetical protein HMPREF3193_01878 [Bifidobacterium breve]